MFDALPFYARKGCTFIFSSSLPRDRDCMFYRALNSDRFEVLDVKKICSNCLRKGIKERCKHCPPPKWISRDKDEDMRILAGDDNVEVEHAREMVGIYIDDLEPNRCIPTVLVNDLFDKPRYTIPSVQRIIYIAIDPAGGTGNAKKGNQSELALMAMTENRCIVGLASISVIDDYNKLQVDQEVVNFIISLRRRTLFMTAWFCIAIESNFGCEAMRIKEAIEKDPEAKHKTFFFSDTDLKTGVHLSHKKKQQLVDQTVNVMSAKQVQIANELSGNNVAFDLPALRQQIINMEYIHKAAISDGLHYTKTTISGKRTSQTKDDLAVVFFWLMYIQLEFQSLDKYRHARSLIIT